MPTSNTPTRAVGRCAGVQDMGLYTSAALPDTVDVDAPRVIGSGESYVGSYSSDNNKVYSPIDPIAVGT